MNEESETDETGDDDYLPHEGDPVHPLGLTAVNCDTLFWTLIGIAAVAVIAAVGIFIFRMR